MNNLEIQTSLEKTTTSIDDNNDIDEYLLKTYDELTKIMPISYIFILFVCVGFGWIIYSFCYSIEDNVEKSQSSFIHFTNKIESSKKYKLYLKKIYPKETLFLL